MKRTLLTVIAIALSLGVPAAFGQLAISWSTIDGGGHTFSSGGTFQLGGTIGQFDAQVPPVMSGATFSLTGGFWQGAGCSCRSDMNLDTRRDARDVQGFVTCYIAGISTCSCADLNSDGFLTSADVTLFVGDMLSTALCP